jgi:glycosyltransferase involved in cell wall biosynthesis
LRILYIFSDLPHEYNCSGWNCIDPTNAINKTGVHQAKYIHINDFVRNDQEIQKLCSEADIIMVERNLFQDTLTIMMFWKVRGKAIGTLFDDGYTRMEKLNPAYPFWEFGQIQYKNEKGEECIGNIVPPPKIQLTWGVAMSKGLQTVSQALCDDWKDYTDTFLIHNHLVIDRYKNVTKPLYPHDGIWIGWTGSLSHRTSFLNSGLLRAYRKIVNKYPQVKILITGDKKNYDELDIPESKKIFSAYVPAEQYQALVKSLDICTIPLAGRYDECRSQIKPLECMALKIPFIATNYPNYNHLKEYGNFTENGWQNWFNAMSDAIENLDKYREKAIEVAYPFALTQDIDLHVQERIDLYQHLIDKPYRY